MSNRFSVQEELVSQFIVCLNSAGMQPSFGQDETKPRYFRGYVPSEYASEALYLRYNIDENGTLYTADNNDFIRSIEISGEVCTMNGYGDEDYQTLCSSIENSLKQNRFDMEWGNESTDASFDINNPVYIKRFIVKKHK